MNIWLVVLACVVLLVMTSAFPVVLPIVNELRELPLNPMLARFNGSALLIEILVKFETTLNVATSALTAGVAGGCTPGNVAAPVLQLFSVPVASQFPLVAVAFQLALPARAGLDAKTAARAADAAEAITKLRRFRP